MKKVLYILLTLVLFYIIGAIIGGNVIATHYTVVDQRIDDSLTIAQISDFHSNQSMKDQQEVYEIIQENQVDYILLTGDVFESADNTETLQFVNQLTSLAPVIYTRGNHDDDFGTYNQIVTELKVLGVTVLEDESYKIDNLNFVGIEDNDIATLSTYNQQYIQFIEESGVGDLYDENYINILLAHRPNYLEQYASLNFDYVFSGHAHGGQWQLPFTDLGLLAPDDGFFTTNVHGLKELDNTVQFINSGLSNPYAPIVPRLFNPKEVVIVTIEKQEV